MSLARRLLLADQPGEARFFGFLGVFGLVLGIGYWVTAYEVAGTVLLLGFALACLFGSARLLAARPPSDTTADPDRPFLDESGRLPDATLAPLAVGLGTAMAMTAVVFGPWLLIAGVLPFAWGAVQWLTAARAELDATVDADRTEKR